MRVCGLEVAWYQKLEKMCKFVSNFLLLLSSYFLPSFMHLTQRKGVKSSKSFPGYYIQLMPPHGVLLCYKLLLLVVQ